MEHLSRGQLLPNMLHAVLLIAAVVALILIMPQLPETLPMHFSSDGSVNRYGSAQELWILLGIWLMSAGSLFAISKAPSLTNTPKSLTSKESRRAYQLAMLPALAWVNFWTGFLMMSVLAAIISISLGWIDNLQLLIWPQLGLYLALLALHIWYGHKQAMQAAGRAPFRENRG